MAAVRDRAGHDHALASAAGTVFATIRQADAGADGGVEYGFVCAAIKLPAAGLNGYLERHTILLMNNAIKNNGQAHDGRTLGRPRLLILGCGDVGMRVLPLLRHRFRIVAVTTSAAQQQALRAAGALPLLADLDQPATLTRLARLATNIVHLVPPQSEGGTDRRTRNLIAILPEHANLVYVSTSGVYGDCAGAVVEETRTVRPANPRAIRRLDAEQQLRKWARRSHSCLSILRVPGIYATERLPIARLQQGLPALSADEDVYTNHVHADDLARIIVAALFRGRSGRIYHAVDDTEMKMGAYFDAVADVCALPHPPRLPRAQLAQQVSAMMLSFMSESRRLSNRRIKNELGVRLHHPTVMDFLQGFNPN
jgi:nucleoside-diphosphate-sugar epimerase